MPDLFLDWGDIGPYGTFLPDTDPSAVSATVDTGGVAVDITFDAIAPETRGFTFNAPGYVAPGETFDRQSFFKIISEGGSGTAGSPSPTATTALDFRSTDPLYTDSVQNVGFRLNEVDFSATGGDLSSAGDGWQDIVTVNAFDADGNPVPVTLTPATVAAVSGDTATGTTDGVFESASGSILVEIPGPVSRIEISYANGDTAQQAVLISDVEFSTVDVADDLPVAEDDTATTPEDTAVVIDVLSNDSDPDGQPLTVTSATATNGTVTINPDGTLTYTPDTDYNGPDTILYTIEDPDGNEDTAEVAVTVTPDGVNSDPVAVDDTVDTDIDTSVTLDPTDNDSDPDGDPITLTDIGTPTNGTATLNPDGTVTYTPDTGFVGEDTIPYTIEDGEGGTDTGEIIVTVDDPSNTPPVAVNDTASTPLDTPITVTPLANDSDPDGDPLTVGSIGTPSSGTAVLNPDGTVTYTPEPGFEGTVTIPYTAIDPDDATGTAEIIVTVGDPDNTPPVAVDDEAETDLDTAITIDPTLNDTDADGDPITLTGIGTPTNGTATLNPDGTVTYTPDTGFVGEDTIPYTIEDGEGGTDTGEIIVTVDDPSNTPPVAVNDTASTPLDTPITVTPLANDSDPDGDPLTVGSIGTPSSGTAVLNPDGTVTYTPEPGFEGTVTIPYTAIDPDDATGTAEIIVTVGDPDNTPPVAVDDEAETDLDTAITIDPTLNDTDADGDPITVTGIGTASNGTATLNPDGTVTYTPDTGFVGEDTVSYTIEDGEGGTDTGEIIFSVPCFTPGTLIATPQGERLVEELQVGDRVMTRDNGIQEIRWIGRRDLTGHELARAPEMRPVLIRRGALGPDLPAHDMLVSPQHRVLVSNARTALYFDEREVLVAAKHLIGLEGVDEVDATGVSYIHIMFDQHEVVLSNGAWSESFQPGDYTLGGLGAEQREEIYALFPELALPEGRRAYVAARRSLKRHEAAILTA